MKPLQLKDQIKMRKIESEMYAAFNGGCNWTKGNTRVDVETLGDTKRVRCYLYGNLIAEKIISKSMYVKRFFTGGYDTATTCNRLNALGAGVSRKGGYIHYADGTPVQAYYNPIQ
nr:MAG TPA: hypothetical protein [Bacteriophage sp.]